MSTAEWDNKRSGAPTDGYRKGPLTHLLDSTEGQAVDDTTRETWRPVPGYEGRYDVSDAGRVRSWRTRDKQGNPLVLRGSPLRDGHLTVSLLSGTRESKRTWTVHRLVMLAFVGPLPAGLETRHMDGDPTNNRLGNLVYGTPRENMLDRLRHGRDPHRNKTHCNMGHPYDEENTRYVAATGTRKCRACGRRKAGEYRAARRAAA